MVGFSSDTGVKHFITVRNLGGAQNIPRRQRTEQRERETARLDQGLVVRIRHIEFHHGGRTQDYEVRRLRYGSYGYLEYAFEVS